MDYQKRISRAATIRLETEKCFTLALYDCLRRRKMAWIAEVRTWFRTEWIADDGFRHICEALFRIAKEEIPPTSLEIAKILQRARRKNYDISWITELLQLATAKAGHIRYYAMCVYDEYRKVTASDEIIGNATKLIGTGDPDPILDDIKKIPEKYRKLLDNRGKDNEQAVKLVIDELEGKGPKKTGFGIGSLDSVLDGGLEPSTLTVVGAATSGGKSSLLAQSAIETVLKQGRAIMFFALEMSAKEMYKRWMNYLAGIPGIFSRRTKLEKLAQIEELAKDKGLLHLFCGARSMRQIESEVEAYVESVEVGLVAIDYLQIVVPPKGMDSRQMEVSEIVRRMKQLATMFSVPVLTGSQLNRTSSEKPTLRGLRESGSIEQDADVVLLIDPERSVSQEVDARIIVAKNRNGRLGSVDVRWEKPTHRFFDPQEGTKLGDWND